MTQTKIVVRSTPLQAYSMGVMAAHEKQTPLCPFSSFYERTNYDKWFDGISDERRFIFEKTFKVNWTPK